jgi:hypothetical protein
LAYCSEEELTEKEQYYLNLYQPEYNQLPKDNKEDNTLANLPKLPTSMIEYNAFAKQLVLFQPPNQQITSINPSPSLSLIPIIKNEEYTVNQFIKDKENIVEATKTKK